MMTLLVLSEKLKFILAYTTRAEY